MIADPLLKVGKINEERAESIGFRFGDKGTHTSRTIMYDDLSSVLSICGNGCQRETYIEEIIENNCLAKRTVATRKLSAQRLSELYFLDNKSPVFRIFRNLWENETDEGRRILALLCALARDPLLRVTAPVVFEMKEGTELARQPLTDALSVAADGRFNDSILDKVVRNTASSWTQSGHLEGRGRKIRRKVVPTPFSVTFALFLGYCTGIRGELLFSTFWTRVFDMPSDEFIYLAMDAKKLGMLDVTQSGGIIEVSFLRLLTEEERKIIHGTN
jgi:hypothetical protein